MSRRLAALDALRGFALCGIILGNVTWFSGWAVASADARAHSLTPALDRALQWALHVLVDGKFYGLFSLIFGAGFALLLDAARRRGDDPAEIVRRRLGALAAIGVVHGAFVWFGDIVALYAVAAIPLYWVRNWPARRLAMGAAAMLGAPVVVGVSLLAVQAVLGRPLGEPGHGPATLLPAFAAGDYDALVAANRAFWQERWLLALASGRLPRLLGLFMLGMLAVRRPLAPRPAHRIVLIGAALAANLLLVRFAHVPVRPPSGIGVVRDCVSSVAVPLGAVAYAACLWPRLSRGSAVTTALAAAGRLSLSHYLVQSLVMGALFYGVGLGMWGSAGLAAALGIATAIAVLQVMGSAAWLDRFGAGPAERLLRALTYPKRLHRGC